MKTKSSQSGALQDRPGAIVLGGNFVGLGVVRSLGARGIPTWVIDADASKSIAQFSRYTKRFMICKERVHELLLEEGRRRRLNGWVVFPVSDEYVEVLAAHHRSLSSIYQLTTPPLEVTRFALDKRLTYSRARGLGIAAPWTYSGKLPAGAEAEGLPYPLILKPAVNHHFFPHTNVKALPAGDPAELEARFAQMRKYIPEDEILIQERIPGGGENQFSFCGVCQKGRVYASLVARRMRQYPIEFGNASTFVETVSQPEVEIAGRRFLESIGFDGMVEIEFKFDPRDGNYKILDFNARPWGWHTLGKAAGMDFPYLLWRQKAGLEVSEAGAPRPAAWVREITDLVAVAKASNRTAEIKRLLRAACSRKLTPATFSLLDPIPFFAELALWASSGATRQKKAKDVLQLEPAREATLKGASVPASVGAIQASTVPPAE